MDDLVAVAKITKTRGLKGQVVCDILTDFPERFDELGDVIVVLPDGTQRELKIEEHFFQNGRVILRFSGYDSIETSEVLRGAEVCVPESNAVELDEGAYFDWQLTGCLVETLDGAPIGKVTGLMRTGGTELLVVNGEVKEHLIPFAEAICVEVDVDHSLIKIDPPEGLLDF